MLWARWRYGGEDPFALYNGPEAGVPAFPDRVETFKDACALYSFEQEIKLAGGKIK